MSSTLNINDDTSNNSSMNMTPKSWRSSRFDGRLKLYTSKQLEHTPSRAVGLSSTYEMRLRTYICRFMGDVATTLRLSNLAIATACSNLHHFYMFFPLNHFDKYEVATACLILASKVEEQRVQVHKLVDAVHFGKHRKKLDLAPAQRNELHGRVLSLELLLLQCIGFNFRALHPYSCCRQYVKEIIEPSNPSLNDDSTSYSTKTMRDVTQFAFRFINDSIRTMLCLQYSPQHIALACIHMAVLWRNRACAKKRIEASANQTKAAVDTTMSRSHNDDGDDELVDIVLPEQWFSRYIPDMSKALCHQICDVLLSAIEETAHSAKRDLSKRTRAQQKHVEKLSKPKRQHLSTSQVAAQRNSQ